MDAEHAASFLSDLMSAKGNVVLKERAAGKNEIGKTMAQVTENIIVNAHTDTKNIPFSQRNEYLIEEGDVLLMISETNEATI